MNYGSQWQGGGGFDMRSYREHEAAMEKMREEREAKQAQDQAVLDAMTDSLERQDAQRRRYRCGDSFVTLEAVPIWSDYAKTLIPLPNHTYIGAVQSWTGRGYNSMSMPNADEKVGESDVLRRCSIRPDLNDKVSVLQGDITHLEIDGIVNAANDSLLGGGGIDGAIHAAAGGLLYRECKALNGCETGQTKVTRGYCLPARYVLHTVGPAGRGDGKLRSCYETVLQEAIEKKLRSIAFCCISTGIYSFPLIRATHIALRTVRLWLEVPEHAAAVDRIIFCTFRDVERAAYERLMPSYFPIDGLPLQECPEELRDAVPINEKTVAMELERETAERARYFQPHSSYDVDGRGGTVTGNQPHRGGRTGFW